MVTPTSSERRSTAQQAIEARFTTGSEPLVIATMWSVAAGYVTADGNSSGLLIRARLRGWPHRLLPRRKRQWAVLRRWSQPVLVEECRQTDVQPSCRGEAMAGVGKWRRRNGDEAG